MPSGLIWGITLFYFTASITYGISKVWLHTEKQKQQLSLEKTEAELNLLRAQLHPHFLFNVLNNLLAMIDQKASPELAHSLNKLSGLLRYVVNDTAQDKVPINKEIKFIKDFAELQSLGYEEGEIKFDLSINGPYGLQLIEPGIFVPFIENAFKYGVEPEKESTIKVTFDVTNERKIRFKITNPIHLNMQHMESSNTGIRSTQERLQLVYPDRHSLTIDQDELFSVQLEITTEAINLIKGYLDHFNSIELVGTFRNGIKALEFLNKEKVDLIFLDINMPHLSGLSLSRMTDAEVLIIFTTAYSEYAVESYEVEAFDYLLKPISFTRFSKTMSKIIALKAIDDIPRNEFLMIKSGANMHRVKADEIYYLKKEGNYIAYNLLGREIISRQSISQALSLLPDQFIQTQKSYIVNTDKIEYFNKEEVSILRQSIPIGMSYKAEVISKIGMKDH